MKYLIRDDEGNLMRITGRKEEALAILKVRPEWVFQGVSEKRTPRINLLQLPDALM